LLPSVLPRFENASDSWKVWGVFLIFTQKLVEKVIDLVWQFAAGTSNSRYKCIEAALELLELLDPHR
jgi:hypothetical protein